MKNKKSLFLFTIGLLLVTLLGFAAVYEKKQQPKEPLSATAFKLNTVVTVNIYDSKDKKLLDETMELCDHYEKLFSRTLSSSEISRLNGQTLKQENGAFVLSPPSWFQKVFTTENFPTALLILPLHRYPLSGILPLKKKKYLLRKQFRRLFPW